MPNKFDFGRANAGQRNAIKKTDGPVLIIAAPEPARHLRS